MKALTYLTEMAVAAIVVFSFSCCNSGSPGNAVKAAMEKEMIKEKAMEYLEENDVPAIVVKEFNNNHSDTITRQWLVYKKTPEEVINVELPGLYIVSYNRNAQGYCEKYSDKGEIIETNRMINFSVLPDKASVLFTTGTYKAWEVSGDILEILDHFTNEPVGYVVTVVKSDNQERIFFNREGDITKIQVIE